MMGVAGAASSRPLRPPPGAQRNASDSRRWSISTTEAPGIGSNLRSPPINSSTSLGDGDRDGDGVHASSAENVIAEDGKSDAVLDSEPGYSVGKSGLDMGRIWTVSLRSGTSGAAAGAVQVLALMWLKTAVNYQYRYGMDIRQAFRELWAQGGMPRFYQGLSYALIQGPLSRFGGSFSNELARELCEGVLGIQSTVFLGTLLGSLFSTIWRFMLMPIDTCKTVLQVEGPAGIDRMFQTIWMGRTFAPLYRGTVATLVTNLVSYFPWFFVYNTLSKFFVPPEKGAIKLFYSASIGFTASVASDCVSNSVRVLKVMKQTSHSSISYLALLRQVLQRGRGGAAELMLRGLTLRILSNGLQSVLFVIVWRALIESSVGNYNSISSSGESSYAGTRSDGEEGLGNSVS